MVARETLFRNRLKGYSIPKSNFCSKDSICTLRENDKKQSKSKSKSPKIVREKQNFSPFRTGSEIADCYDTWPWSIYRIFSVWQKRLWSPRILLIFLLVLQTKVQTTIRVYQCVCVCEWGSTDLFVWAVWQRVNWTRILTRHASPTWSNMSDCTIDRHYKSKYAASQILFITDRRYDYTFDKIK